MKRYSALYGTDLSTTDMQLGRAAELYPFLNSLGFSDAQRVMDRVNSYLYSFSKLPGYDEASSNAKPVAVRYAPMHLPVDSSGKKAAFCAVVVSGSENRVGRFSAYGMTTFFARELMLKAQAGYNYLDQIFGTYLLDWKRETAFVAYREDKSKGESLPFNMMPTKVRPVLKRSDLPVVFEAISAAVNNRSIMLVLENECDFNTRSMELLAEIYAFLPPYLAMETGFATYQNPSEIANSRLLTETSIRFFVVPSGAAPKESDGYSIIDLNRELPKLQKTELNLVIQEWTKLKWEDRQPAMAACFDGVDLADLLKEETYIERSKAYFAAKASLAQWAAEAGKTGTAQNLATLQAAYLAHPEWKLVPESKTVFKNKVPELTGGKSLAGMASEALAESYVNKDAEAAKQYKFAADFVQPDLQTLCKAVVEKQQGNDEAVAAAAMAEAKAVAAKELEDVKASNERTVAQLNSDREKALAEKDAAYADMTAKKEAAYASMVAEKDAAYAGMVTEKDNAFASMVAEKEAAYAGMVAEKDQAYAAMHDKAQSMLDSARARIKKTEAELAGETEARNKAEAELAQTSEALTNAQNRLGRAEEEFKRIRESLSKTTAERDNALRDRDSAKEECESVKAELDAIPRDLRGAKSRIDELQDELERTPALVRKAWWLPPLLTLLAGALIVGVLWIVLGGISSKKAAAALHEAEARSDKAEQTVSALEDENKELRNEIEELRNEIEELQSAADEQVVPSVNENSDEVVPTEEEPEVTPEAPAVDYAGWDDEEKVNGFLEANADVKSIAFAEEAAEMVPGELRGEWYALAAFSVEENLSNESGSIAILLKAAPAVDPSAEGGLNAALHNVNSVSITASGEDGTTADDSVTAGEPVEAEEPAAETAETGTTETREENQDSPVVKFYGAVLKITCGDEMLLVYGDDDMVTAAMEAVPALFENADEVMKVLLNAARSDEEPDLAVDPEMILTKEVLWGESVRWIVDPSRLNAAAENLNTARMPIFGITNGEAASWIYDYRDAPEKITVFMEAYASTGQVTVQNEFVILTVANAPAETEKTEEPAV